MNLLFMVRDSRTDLLPFGRGSLKVKPTSGEVSNKASGEGVKLNGFAPPLHQTVFDVRHPFREVELRSLIEKICCVEAPVKLCYEVGIHPVGRP